MYVNISKWPIILTIYVYKYVNMANDLKRRSIVEWALVMHAFDSTRKKLLKMMELPLTRRCMRACRSICADLTEQRTTTAPWRHRSMSWSVRSSLRSGGGSLQILSIPPIDIFIYTHLDRLQSHEQTFKGNTTNIIPLIARCFQHKKEYIILQKRITVWPWWMCFWTRMNKKKHIEYNPTSKLLSI